MPKRKPGAGRPRLDPHAPTSPREVTLTPAQWDKAKAIGDGHYSPGIRRALDHFPDPKKKVPGS